VRRLRLMVVALVLMISTALADQYQPPHQAVVDSLGNHLVTYEWVKFSFDDQFHHPNGDLYPKKWGETVWVLAQPRQANRFRGWMTIGGFAAGAVDGYNQGYLQHGWRTWDEVERFAWIAGAPMFWGLALDSQYPDACRWTGGLQGGLAAVSIIRHSDNDDGQTIALAAGAAAGSYIVGWLLDKYRHRPAKGYRYYLR